MKRHVMALAALAATASPAMAGCDLDAIAKALDAPLAAMKHTEREVSDVQSTEGGVWRIYRAKDGRLHTLVRLDGGESGSNDMRLSVVDRATYGIARTRTDYIRHAFVEEGPFGIARRTTEYFYYCGGKPYVPGPNGATVDLEQYPKDAAAAQKAMLDDKDVVAVTKGLARP